MYSGIGRNPREESQDEKQGKVSVLLLLLANFSKHSKVQQYLVSCAFLVKSHLLPKIHTFHQNLMKVVELFL